MMYSAGKWISRKFVISREIFALVNEVGIDKDPMD